MQIKRSYLAALALTLAASAPAQTLLEEDFETGNTGSALTPVAKGEGWTVVNGYSGTQAKYNWHNYYSSASGENSTPTISGNCCAKVDAAMFSSDAEGRGPREEFLITPELDLDDTYQLTFSFKVSPLNHKDSEHYDLQVRVVTGDDIKNTETIFSIHNQKMLHDSGITVFPIDDWNIYTPKIDLSDFKGEKVKLAFVYKMDREIANVAYLDDVAVKRFDPPTGPVATINLDRYNFGEAYIGEHIYSEAFTLGNIGKDGLKITSIDLPDGFRCTLDADNVNLGSYDNCNFQFVYAPEMTSATSGNAVLHTTGGDVTIALSATKQFVPEGYTLETFNKHFPPAGWNNNGWGSAANALEGERSAVAQGNYTKATLRSPKIDLTDGGRLKFTYFNYFDSENENGAPQYDITVEVSYDGGDNWITKWTSDWQYGLNQLLTADVDLGYGDENCYVRWVYPAVESDDEGAYEHSIFYLDRVLLPNLVGAGGAPARATVVSPANGAVDVYPNDVKLEWGPAQFADGYKVYVGTNTEVNDLVNGVDVGEALTYTIPQACAYATKYYWKIVAYNEKGNGTASRWSFTTQADATVTEYPYVENFTDTDNLPTGWTSVPGTNTYNRSWYINSLYPYADATNGESYNVLSSGWLNPNDFNATVTAEFSLPADKAMNISFEWGDEHPSSLKIDPAGTTIKNNAVPDNGISYTNFDILADGQWTTLSTLSEPYPEDSETKFWHHETIDLSAFKGKNVTFRWVHYSLSTKDNGASVTHIVVDENKDNLAEFNAASWNAGKVNFGKAVNSGDIFTIFNRGTADLTVKEVTFETGNFEASLKGGDLIKTGEPMKFNIRFTSNQTVGQVDDDMTVEFESGYTVSFPVSGEGLPEGTFYYAFEPNPLDYVWDEDFTMIDADKSANYSFTSSWVNYSADGIRGAFSAENDSYETGMYGMMKPVSGMWALVGASPQNTSADNWIISRTVTATAKTAFDFWGRNWSCAQTVLPNPNHCVTVLVTEVLDNPKTSDFTVVMPQTEMPLLDNDNWNHYNVDLSDYAGKQIRIALRHTTPGVSDLAFFDDFTISGTGANSGIGAIPADLSDAEVEVFGISGIKVAEGKGSEVIPALEHGFYVVRVTDGTNVRSFSIAR